MERILQYAKRFIPRRLFSALQPIYHFSLACLGALVYRFPARSITVVGVTGTKGKSSVIEYINAILEESGHTTALANSIRFKIADESVPNEKRMTMAGRFFLQRLLRRAVKHECDVVIIEITSEGAEQFRHLFLSLDALVFTNLAPEHIESHGSFEAYANAKLSIGRALTRSRKRPRIMVANADDDYGARFLSLSVDDAIPFSLSNVRPYESSEHGGHFTFAGTRMHIHLPGRFSLYNALAAATVTYALGASLPIISRGLESVRTIPGRAERIDEGQPYPVVVDYAHTPDSLQALYDAYGNYTRICVLGATGGGRDRWKRPKMGAIAEANCAHVILTNEDPYDEDPKRIIADIAGGMNEKPEIIMDRRDAIQRALELADDASVVLITGKGTDPNICGPRGARTAWSDAAVAREALKKKSAPAT